MTCDDRGLILGRLYDGRACAPWKGAELQWES